MAHLATSNEGLEQGGYRVLAANQRGYGRSDKPKGIWAYDIDILAADVIALAASEGYERFHLVGHDWGGIIAFQVASLFPMNVRSLTALNAPHPRRLQNICHAASQAIAP